MLGIEPLGVYALGQSPDLLTALANTREIWIVPTIAGATWAGKTETTETWTPATVTTQVWTNAA